MPSHSTASAAGWGVQAAEHKSATGECSAHGVAYACGGVCAEEPGRGLSGCGPADAAAPCRGSGTVPGHVLLPGELPCPSTSLPDPALDTSRCAGLQGRGVLGQRSFDHSTGRVRECCHIAWQPHAGAAHMTKVTDIH